MDERLEDCIRLNSSAGIPRELTEESEVKDAVSDSGAEATWITLGVPLELEAELVLAVPDAVVVVVVGSDDDVDDDAPWEVVDVDASPLPLRDRVLGLDLGVSFVSSINSTDVTSVISSSGGAGDSTKFSLIRPYLVGSAYNTLVHVCIN